MLRSIEAANSLIFRGKEAIGAQKRENCGLKKGRKSNSISIRIDREIQRKLKKQSHYTSNKSHLLNVGISFGRSWSYNE